MGFGSSARLGNKILCTLPCHRKFVHFCAIHSIEELETDIKKIFTHINGTIDYIQVSEFKWKRHFRIKIFNQCYSKNHKYFTIY